VAKGELKLSDFDPEEIVNLPCVGDLTIRTVVRRLAQGALPERAYYDLFRDTQEPSVIALTTVEARRLATLPEYRDGREQ
jgi:hypothetical protein